MRGSRSNKRVRLSELQRPCEARSLQPGVSGFLFSVNPQHSQRAAREAAALLSQYVDRVLIDSGEVPPSSRGPRAAVEHTDTAAPQQAVATGLAAELAAAPRRGPCSHPLLRQVEIKVKGYIFISVSQPSSSCDAAEDPSVDDATVDHPEQPVEDDPRTVVCEENTLVAALADTLWDDLVANPKPVTKYTFRCFPCGASCVPTRPDLIAEATRRMACSWYAECVSTEGHAAAATATWVSVVVKNNTKIEPLRDSIQLTVARALPSDRFLLQPTYIAKAASAIVATGRPTLCIVILIMHSVALISLQPWYPLRYEYHLGRVAKEGAPTLASAVTLKGEE